MITFETYIAYFKTLSLQHVDIAPGEIKKTFFRMNIDEIIGSMRSIIDPDKYVMALESYEHASKDEHSDNHLREYIGAFMILKKVPTIDDFTQQDIVITKAEEIAIEISRRIYADSLDFENKPRFFKNIELNNFTFQKVGPIFNEWYGIRCQFSFSDSYQIAVDGNKWQDIEDPPIEPSETTFNLIVNIDEELVYDEVWESQATNTINIT